MGDYTFVVFYVYTPMAVVFAVLAYLWDFMISLKRSESEIECFASQYSYFP